MKHYLKAQVKLFYGTIIDGLGDDPIADAESNAAIIREAKRQLHQKITNKAQHMPIEHIEFAFEKVETE